MAVSMTKNTNKRYDYARGRWVKVNPERSKIQKLAYKKRAKKMQTEKSRLKRAESLRRAWLTGKSRFGHPVRKKGPWVHAPVKKTKKIGRVKPFLAMPPRIAKLESKRGSSRAAGRAIPKKPGLGRKRKS